MPVNYALFTVALISFLLYAKAINTVFSNDYVSEGMKKVLLTCATLFAFIHLWLLWRTPVHSHKLADLASLCYIAGLIIFLSAKKALSTYGSILSFAPDLPSWILNKGIYGVIRHPFFLAFILTWLGGALEAHCLRTTISTAIMLCFYWLAAKRQEHKYETSMLAAEFRSYKNRTGMFLPPIKLFR
jgi:protein-S-isoprenylcysteine O-methyltransferase Ste14